MIRGEFASVRSYWQVLALMANHLIADRGWKTPNGYRKSFRILQQEGVLDEELAGQMDAWAGLRNVLVHLYLEVDRRRLYEILQSELDQLERFAGIMLNSVDEERGE